MIESLLARYGLSYRWLAVQLNTSHTNIRNWLSPDGNPPRDRKRDVYSEMLEALQTRGPIDKKTISAERLGMRMVHIVMAAGAGLPNSYQRDSDFEMIPDWGTEFERNLMPVSGDSMADWLKSGDLALVEYGRKIEPGYVVSARKDGEQIIKCLRGEGANAQFWSFNETDGQPPFSAKDWDVEGIVVGRVQYGVNKIRSYTDFGPGLSWAVRDSAF